MDAPESSQLCRGEDSLQYRCGAKAANDLDAFIAGRPVSCIPISLDQCGRTVATCSVGGVDLGELCAIALHSIGRNIRKANSTRSNARQSMRVEACGRAVMLSRGCIESASEPVAGQLIAPTTRTPTLEGRSNAETPPSVSIGRGHFLSEATPLRTACVHDA